MKMNKLHVLLALALTVSVAGVGCDKQEEANTDEQANAEGAAAEQAPEIKADKGVDLENKTIHVGALNDTSGPAVTIGQPFVTGKNLVAERINAGDLWPEGWKVEMHNKDHGYNPQKALQAYKEMSDDILYIATSFGTPPTLQVRPMLERDKTVAFPASLSTKLAENEFTPPIGPTYKMETMRAVDWMVEHAKEQGADFKPGILYQDDDYGQDGISGIKQAAKAHGVDIVAEAALKPGEKNVTAAIKKLQEAGANYVMLTLLPSSAGPVLGTSAQLGYNPVFVGNTPAWVDVFFDKKNTPLPQEAFSNFYWVTGFPYWGEDVPGMKEFEAAFDKYAEGESRDFYVLLSYVQGLAQAEIVKRAIENKDLTREGFVKAMHSIEEFDAGGLIQPVSLKEVPYVTGTKTRVLEPDFENKSWKVVGDYKTPKAFKGGGDQQAQKQGNDQAEAGK